MFAFVTSERFNLLEAKDRDRLEMLAKLDEFKAGQEISASGKPVEWLCLIAAGGVDVRAKTKSGEVTLVELGPGDIFGEAEAFADLPKGVRHVARVDTIVRAVPKHPLMQELKAHRSLASGLLAVYCRSISEKVRSTNEVAIKLGPVPPGMSRPPPPAGATAKWWSAKARRAAPSTSSRAATWRCASGSPASPTGRWRSWARATCSASWPSSTASRARRQWWR